MKKRITLVLIFAANWQLIGMQHIIRIQKRFISQLTEAQQITRINKLAKRISKRAKPVRSLEGNAKTLSRSFIYNFLSLVDDEQLISNKTNLEIEEDIENIFFTLKDNAELKKQKPFLDRLQENKQREP